MHPTQNLSGALNVINAPLNYFTQIYVIWEYFKNLTRRRFPNWFWSMNHFLNWRRKIHTSSLYQRSRKILFGIRISFITRSNSLNIFANIEYWAMKLKHDWNVGISLIMTTIFQRKSWERVSKKQWNYGKENSIGCWSF